MKWDLRYIKSIYRNNKKGRAQHAYLFQSAVNFDLIFLLLEASFGSLIKEKIKPPQITKSATIIIVIAILVIFILLFLQA